MNVMQIVSGAGVNGVVIHCLLLTRALARRGHDVTLVCRDDAWIAGELAGERVRIVESDLRRWPLTELRRVAGLVCEHRIDVINTHMTRAHNFGALLSWRTGVPWIATAHAHTVHLQWRFATHVIAVSEATRRFHIARNHVRPERIETVHNFVDCERFCSVSPEERAAARQSVGAGEDDLLIGMIGDIVPRKGQLEMIRAMPRVLAALPKARLAAVGIPKGWPRYLPQVQAEAASLGVDARVCWAGYRSDIPAITAGLDLCALASDDEPFGLVLIEAMAAGVPVVATAVGGIPEFVLPGETGTLASARDPEALAEAIVSVLRDPERSAAMCARARDMVRARFSVESQTPAIERVYAKVRERRRA